MGMDVVDNDIALLQLYEDDGEMCDGETVDRVESSVSRGSASGGAELTEEDSEYGCDVYCNSMLARIGFGRWAKTSIP